MTLRDLKTIPPIRSNRARTIALTAVAMLAFAANSILCRLALAETNIDPASFTIVRIASGAAMLWAIAAIARRGKAVGGSWSAAIALFAYAAAFSFAYVSLAAGVGALLLFGAVQATMVIAGIVRGDHPTPQQWLGLAIALAGLIALVAPGVSAPPLFGAVLMLAAGAAWGAYSILGRRSADFLAATAGNFFRASPIALVLAVPAFLGRPPGRGAPLCRPVWGRELRTWLRDMVRRAARLEPGRRGFRPAQRPGDHRAGRRGISVGADHAAAHPRLRRCAWRDCVGDHGPSATLEPAAFQ